LIENFLTMFQSCDVHAVVWMAVGLVAFAGSTSGAEPPSAPDEHQATLDDLAWMVGDWVVEQEDEGPTSADESHQTIAVHVRWSPTRAFLIREMTIHHDAARVAHYTQRIGRDARTHSLRSWLFDDQGSHGEASWTKKGDALVARSTTVLPDGSEVSARTEYRHDGNDRCTWESVHTHDGAADVQPLRLVLVRASAPLPAATTTADDDDVSRKAAIMNGPRWQQAVFELGQWLATQSIYSSEEVLRIKAGFNDRVAHASADDLAEMLDDLDAKLRIVDSPEARDARDWVGHYLSALSDRRRARALADVPDITKMSVAELQAEIENVTQKRSGIQQRQAAFESGRRELVEQARQTGQRAAAPPSGGRAVAVSPPRRDGEPPFSSTRGPGMTIYTGGGFGGAGVAISVGNF
jgi:hypothetical protein